MILKKFKPYTSGIRHKTIWKSDEITYDGPSFPSLTKNIKRSYGKDNNGRITCRAKQRGAKYLYRVIDFKRDKKDIPAKVIRIERDPNRNCNIALLKYNDGEYRYILSPKGLKVDSSIVSSSSARIAVGNSMKLKNIPSGNIVHCIELNIGEGAKMARSAGTYAKILSYDGTKCKLSLPSGEIRYIHGDCIASIGVVGNLEIRSQTIGKAGRNRLMGRRPIVRGSAKNPVDHPHGGGSDRTPIGRIPVSPNGIKWGTITRKRRKYNTKMIVKRARERKK